MDGCEKATPGGSFNALTYLKLLMICLSISAEAASFLLFALLRVLRRQSVNDLTLLVIIQIYLNAARGRLNFQAADPDQIWWRCLMRDRNDHLSRHLDIRYSAFRR